MGHNTSRRGLLKSLAGIGLLTAANQIAYNFFPDGDESKIASRDADPQEKITPSVQATPTKSIDDKVQTPAPTASITATQTEGPKATATAQAASTPTPDTAALKYPLADIVGQYIKNSNGGNELDPIFNAGKFGLQRIKEGNPLGIFCLYYDLIMKEAIKNRVDKSIALSLFWKESGFHPNERSFKDGIQLAVGLGQLVCKWFLYTTLKKNEIKACELDLSNPPTNIEISMNIMRFLHYNKYGSEDNKWNKSLGAYYAGIKGSENLISAANYADDVIAVASIDSQNGLEAYLNRKLKDGIGQRTMAYFSWLPQMPVNGSISGTPAKQTADFQASVFEPVHPVVDGVVAKISGTTVIVEHPTSLADYCRMEPVILSYDGLFNIPPSLQPGTAVTKKDMLGQVSPAGIITLSAQSGRLYHYDEDPDKRYFLAGTDLPVLCMLPPTIGLPGKTTISALEKAGL